MKKRFSMWMESAANLIRNIGKFVPLQKKFILNKEEKDGVWVNHFRFDQVAGQPISFPRLYEACMKGFTLDEVRLILGSDELAKAMERIAELVWHPTRSELMAYHKGTGSDDVMEDVPYHLNIDCCPKCKEEMGAIRCLHAVFHPEMDDA